MKCLLSLVIFLVSSMALASVISRNELGLGFTDNANLTTTDKKSDTYFKIGSSNDFEDLDIDIPINLRFSYWDYSRESTNDFLSLGLGATWWESESALGVHQQFTSRIFHVNYLHSNASTTDESFTNTGFELLYEYKNKYSSSTSFRFAPGSIAKFYSSFQSRVDKIFFLRGSVNHSLNPALSMGARSEVGFAMSSLDAFSKNYLEVGGDIDYDFAEDSFVSLDVSYRSTTYTSRTITEVVAVRNGGGRGGGGTTTIQSLENAGLMSLTLEIDHYFTKPLLGRSGLTLNRQKSASGLLDYDSNEIFASLVYRL